MAEVNTEAYPSIQFYTHTAGTVVAKAGVGGSVRRFAVVRFIAVVVEEHCRVF
jgi:hypothetical protein